MRTIQFVVVVFDTLTPTLSTGRERALLRHPITRMKARIIGPLPPPGRNKLRPAEAWIHSYVLRKLVLTNNGTDRRMRSSLMIVMYLGELLWPTQHKPASVRVRQSTIASIMRPAAVLCARI
jgi:hypothetical protein